MNLCRQCAYARMPGREKGNAPEGSSGARRKRKCPGGEFRGKEKKENL